MRPSWPRSRRSGSVCRTSPKAAAQADAFKANPDFHMAVAWASGNAMIAHVQRMLLEAERQAMQSVTQEDRTAQQATQHAGRAPADLRGDPRRPASRSRTGGVRSPGDQLDGHLAGEHARSGLSGAPAQGVWSGSLRQPTMPSSPAAPHGVAAAGDLQLRQQRRDVVVDGLGRDEQPLGDLGVGRSVGEQAQDLDLAAGEPGGVGQRRLAPARRDRRRRRCAAGPGGPWPPRRRRRAGRAGRARPACCSAVPASTSASAWSYGADSCAHSSAAAVEAPVELESVRLGDSVRLDVHRGSGAKVGVEPAQPRRELAAGPLQADARRRGEQRAALARAGGRRCPAATPARPAPRPPAAAGSARRTGRPASHACVEVGVGVAAAAQGDQPANEVRPRPGERGARASEHRVGVGERVVPVAPQQLHPPARAELPHAADRQVALDR